MAEQAAQYDHRAKEPEAPDGIEYRVGDATHLPQLGRFDLVTAVYLLNYATSREQMLRMFRGAYDNLNGFIIGLACNK